MKNNKTYIWVSFIVLIFGIYAIPKIITRIKNGTVTQNNRMGVAPNSTSKKSGLFKIGPMPRFSLTNQNNQTINNASYNGKVFLVEFFFTTCPTICLVMNKNMVELQDHFNKNKDFGIASITIDPKNDTPENLKKHSITLGATIPNWNFLTGDQDYILNLSNKGFSMYAALNSKIPGGFEHSGLFAIIDKDGNIRCRKDEFGNPIVYYDGLTKQGIEMIKKDVALLLIEE